jgi:hypothetical protein
MRSSWVVLGLTNRVIWRDQEMATNRQNVKSLDDNEEIWDGMTVNCSDSCHCALRARNSRLYLHQRMDRNVAKTYGGAYEQLPQHGSRLHHAPSAAAVATTSPTPAV